MLGNLERIFQTNSAQELASFLTPNDICNFKLVQKQLRFITIKTGPPPHAALYVRSFT